MEHQSPPNLTQDERLMSLFCHIIGGIILSIILYFVMSDSKFVRFHALQSIFFHSLMIILIMILFIIYFFIANIMRYNDSHVCLLFLILLCIIGFSFGSLIYSIMVGVSAFQGKLKEYPIVGRWAYDKIYQGLYF
ncbi:MAG: DUF4870 domain-containing protein [Ignavibacteriae bacterium]|nr:DUF4870 domain-containing protein [Ignavibacteriota bacterium]MCB9243637.1 DUF4870 domain-containing protein [Ignavibacteriales bacterium]